MDPTAAHPWLKILYDPIGGAASGDDTVVDADTVIPTSRKDEAGMARFGVGDVGEEVVVVAVVLGDAVRVPVDPGEFGLRMDSHHGMDVGGDDIQEFVVRSLDRAGVEGAADHRAKEDMVVAREIGKD